MASISSSSSSFTAAITGGLVANGDGPWPIAVTGGRRRDDGPGVAPGENNASEDGKPPPADVDPVGEVAGGLVAELVGIGGEPELNSAKRGHLRFVSAEMRKE